MPIPLSVAIATLCVLVGVAITIWGLTHGLWAWRAWRRASITWMLVLCVWCLTVVWTTWH